MLTPLSCARTILTGRYLIGVWVWKDLRSRYVGSAGGWLWAAVFPAAMMATYFFIFSFFLKVRVPYAPGATGYFLFLMSGLLPWGAMSEGLARSTTVFVDQSVLVQKVAFPLEILPAYITIASLFQPLVGLAIFAVLAAFIKGLAIGCVLLIPVVVALQFVFTMGLAFLLSGLAVFIRDIAQGVQVFLQIWFFASPILYPSSMIPEALKWSLYFNPLAMLTQLYQGLFLRDRISVYDLVGFFVWTVIVFCAGTALFGRLKDSISDLV